MRLLTEKPKRLGGVNASASSSRRLAATTSSRSAQLFPRSRIARKSVAFFRRWSRFKRINFEGADYADR
jgi:hypothetical protein